MLHDKQSYIYLIIILRRKWILVNIPQDEVEGNIHQYSQAWGEYLF